MKKILNLLFKGAWVGGTLTVPGVSGGSMAMILGVYDRLLTSVNAFVKKKGDKKNAFLFLLWFALGGACGFIIFSSLVGLLLDRFPLYVCFFFVGAIIGGVPVVLKQAQIDKIKPMDIVMTLIGIITVRLIALIPPNIFSIDGTGGAAGFALKILCGIILAFGLVLPGISLSQMLYVFGIYGEVVSRVSTLDILPLIPFGIGGIIGIFATSLAVEKLLARFPRAVYSAIFGFLLGSAPTMFKGQSLSSASLWEYPIFLIICAAGFAAVYAMSKFASRESKI